MLPSDPAFQTAIQLRRSLTRLTRRLRMETRAFGLSAARHSILGQLYLDGPKTPSALAAAEGIQPQSITRTLAELEASGHAVRRQHEMDRRQFVLEITPDGTELLHREARQRAVWLHAAMTACLSHTEQELLRLAAQLMDRLAGVPADQDSGVTL